MQSQAPLSSPGSLSPGNPPIKREDPGRNGISPLRDFDSPLTSAAPAVSIADTKDDDSPEMLFARPVAAAPSPRDVNGVQPALARPTGSFEGLRRTEPLQHKRVVGEKRRIDSAPTSGCETSRRSPYIPGLRRAAMPTTVATPKLRASKTEYREPGIPAVQSSDSTFAQNQTTSTPLYGLDEVLGGGASHYHHPNYNPLALPPSHQPLQYHASIGHLSASSRTSSSLQSQTTTYASPCSQQRPALHDYSPLGYQSQNVSSYETTSHALSYGQYGQQNSRPSPYPQHWETGYESRPGQAHARGQQNYQPSTYHQVREQHNDLAQYHHQTQYGSLSNYGSEPSNVYGTMQQQYQPRRQHPHGLSQYNVSQYQPPNVMLQQRTPAHEGFTSAMLRRRATRNRVELGSVSQGSQRSASPDKAERNRRQDFW